MPSFNNRLLSIINYSNASTGKSDSLRYPDEVNTAIKTHSRQYAKRQYTWFKNQMPVHWFEAQNRDEIYSEVKEWLMDEDK